MRVVEIFSSIDGEAIRMGLLANFIRLSGCNLRCNYCDTSYALEEHMGNEMTINEILDQLDNNIKNVTLTGGEPLHNKQAASELLSALTKAGYNVSVETNGSIDLEYYITNFKDVCYITDYKCPSSGMEASMNINNFNILRNIDVVKFVVGNNIDLMKMKEINPNIKAQIFVSPIYGQIEPFEIVDFLKEHYLTNIRLQIQLHKIVWIKDRRGV